MSDSEVRRLSPAEVTNIAVSVIDALRQGVQLIGGSLADMDEIVERIQTYHRAFRTQDCPMCPAFETCDVSKEVCAGGGKLVDHS